LQYQLVLQFPYDGVSDYDRAIELENELIEVLGDSGDVDGHDVGGGKLNIFVHTDDVESVFEQARSVVERVGLLPSLRSAYRHLPDGEEFTVIWPLGAQDGFDVL